MRWRSMASSCSIRVGRISEERNGRRREKAEYGGSSSLRSGEATHKNREEGRKEEMPCSSATTSSSSTSSNQTQRRERERERIETGGHQGQYIVTSLFIRSSEHVVELVMASSEVIISLTTYSR
ncbi:hypothetical protein LINGRAHAP2_LOCUS18280, partial [Linum grandiflorum]